MDEKVFARFWSKVDKSGPVPEHCPELGPCWVWTGGKTGAGYGQLRVSSRAILAHRLSWALINGEPGELCVLHSCDQPACVRPQHLFLGTHAANMADMIRKGRHGGPFGETHPHGKLSSNDVFAILDALKKGATHRSLASRYGVSHHSIGAIARGQAWRHLR